MGMGLRRTGHTPLGLAAMMRGYLAAMVSGRRTMLVCASALCLAGCGSVGGLTGAVAGIAMGSAVANPAVGVAVGIGVQAGVDASIKTVLRHWSHEEQTRIAAVAGGLQVGQRQSWVVRHALPYGNARGEVEVVRAFASALASCKEAVFTVQDSDSNKADEPQPRFLTTVCEGRAGWAWAAAEPAVERWGALQ